MANVALDRAQCWLLIHFDSPSYEGKKTQSIDRCITLMQAVDASPKLRIFFRLIFPADKETTQFSNGVYEKEVKPSLIEKIIALFKTKSMSFQNLDYMRTFLHGDSADSQYQQAIEYIQTLENDQTSLIEFKLFLNQTIPIALSHRLGIDYDISPQTRVARLLRTPQVNDLSFSDPYTTMLLTTLAYRRSLNNTQVEKQYI